MPSNRAEPRSIATQLVLLFTLSAALLLSCSLGIFYWMVVRHAYIEDNAVQTDKISAVAADLQRTGPDTSLLEQIQPARPGEPSLLYVRILDERNRVVAETPRMQQLAPPEVFSDPAQLAPIRARSYKNRGRLFYLLSKKVEAHAQNFTIQVAQDRSEDEEFRRQFGILFLVVLAIGVLAAALIAMSVTRRGLQPLVKLTRSLEGIGPSKLHERIGLARWPRELRPVAAAYDGMLSRLEDSFVRLSQFSADLAHELRTPVGNILGEAQVSLTRARSSDEYRAALESTVAECERLSLIVDNLLFLARAETKDRQIERSLIDGRAAAEKMAAYYETVADDRGISLLCAGQGRLFADPLLFDRAVGNVIDNAFRFTPAGGEIRIGIGESNGETRVAISDTGSGIPPEAQPRVFDRFFRVDPSRSTAGTGLGLSLVRSIMELHGGSAEIESAVGKGTTVTLSFPR